MLPCTVVGATLATQVWRATLLNIAILLLETKFAAVILPVVLTGFDPSAAMLATTLALPYVAGNPVNKLPLPMK